MTLIVFIVFSLRNISIKKFSLFKINFFSYLGKISYSFYLFHFPVLYFLDLYFPNNYILVGSFLLTFLLFTFSYFYIENYFRYKKLYFLDFKKFKLIFLFLFLIVLIYLFNLPVVLPFKGSAYATTFKSCLFSKQYLIDRSFEERKIFTKEYSDNFKIYRFDLLDLLCDKDNCDLNAKNNNKLLYFRDNIHLTYKGSENLTSIFDVWLSNLFIR